MGSGRIPDLVDGFQCGIECCVKTDGIVSAINIIVDGAGTTNDGNAEFLAEDLCTSKGSVSTYCHQPFNAMLLQLGKGFFPTFFGREFAASGRFQNRTASLQDVAYGQGLHLFNVSRNHSVVSIIYTVHIQFMEDTGSYHCPDTGIHSGSVPSGSKNTNFFHFRFLIEKLKIINNAPESLIFPILFEKGAVFL